MASNSFCLSLAGLLQSVPSVRMASCLRSFLRGLRLNVMGMESTNSLQGRL